MTGEIAENPRPAAVDVRQPAAPTSACVFASPHSGRYYPPEFLRESKLSPHDLRRSEDGFVDALFASAPDHGAPLVAAVYPRAYVDVNRAAHDLDPRMFRPPLADFSASGRAASGLGVIPRLVASGIEIYSVPLPQQVVRERLETVYRPYHQVLSGLLDARRQQFGHAVLIDCHSMPSITVEANPADIVLGNRHDASCHAAVTSLAAGILRDLGLKTSLNAPYAGGFSTEIHGHPDQGRHSLQIEIARALYMDEARIEKHQGFAPLQKLLDQFITRFIKEIAGHAGELGPAQRPLAAE